ncbi:TRAP transporter small permease [Shumkonia mesophila]|uniref:TRAP transporter small permease n=1 Tax=Shumkonia mesophila TaxID=2838854 RepID=UPI0029346E37|nr:TRAP transporter small permease [Shumkonia mesophila]
MTDLQDTGSPDRPAARPRPPKIDEILGATAMAIICVISIANVVVRYATDISFAFTEEFSVFLLVFMTMIGTALAFATDDHIRITFFVQRMGPKARRIAGLLSLAATVLVFSLVLWFGALFAFDQWEFEETSAGLGYPTWIYSVWLPILAGVVILRVIQRAVRMRKDRP